MEETAVRRVETKGAPLEDEDVAAASDKTIGAELPKAPDVGKAFPTTTVETGTALHCDHGG